MQGTHYEQIYESRVGDDTLINTNEPSAAALIRAQGQQLRKETVLELSLIHISEPTRPY